jgi:hypothetical protein
MPFVTPDQAAALQQSVVRAATMAELQFGTGTMRLWNGAGITTIAGVDWQGIGGLGSIDNLHQTRAPVSNKVTLRLSGVDATVIALAVGDIANVRGHPAFIWQQLFDANWQPVGAMLPMYWGIMQRINIVRTEGKDLVGAERDCEVEVENPFASRARPSSGRFTDADQQAKYPGDNFFRFAPLQRNQVIVWPDY